MTSKPRWQLLSQEEKLLLETYLDESREDGCSAETPIRASRRYLKPHANFWTLALSLTLLGSVAMNIILFIQKQTMNLNQLCTGHMTLNCTDPELVNEIVKLTRECQLRVANSRQADEIYRRSFQWFAFCIGHLSTISKPRSRPKMAWSRLKSWVTLSLLPHSRKSLIRCPSPPPSHSSSARRKGWAHIRSSQTSRLARGWLLCWSRGHSSSPLPSE